MRWARADDSNPKEYEPTLTKTGLGPALRGPAETLACSPTKSGPPRFQGLSVRSNRKLSYHSCNDRHCPQCGGQDAQQWLDENAALLLPVNYFLVTFTVPEGLRRWIRSHSRLGYDLLLAASSQALQDLAQNPKRLGATLGLLGVLHTWTRTLEYHPHVHYLVPGGGLSRDQRQWIASRPRFLLPVKALSDRCRTLFREALQKQMPEALECFPE